VLRLNCILIVVISPQKTNWTTVALKCQSTRMYLIPLLI